MSGHHTTSEQNAERPLVTVVGAGLAGSECALQLADLGWKVQLIEMRGKKLTPAHKTTKSAELVCSNSFGSQADSAAPGQLKKEAELLNSYILKAAKMYAVPAGQAMAVDREKFSEQIHTWICENPHIEIVEKVVESLDEIPRPAVIATGPLTDDSLTKSLQQHFGGEFLYFFDAIAPIIATDSIDMNVAWKASRWGKGTDDYINCPMNKEEYLRFVDEIQKARKVDLKEFEKNTPYFEACMPIEVLVDRGVDTPRFGPMKPAGLDDPRTGRWPYAVVQLRQDNKEATAFNIVGFQTKLAYPEQKRIFRLIPGLENAEFLKLGSIHRNLYINSPTLLNEDLSSRNDPQLFFAGQITGVEGYFDSTCIGLLVSRFLTQKHRNEPVSLPPRLSALGSLHNAITSPERSKHFQPTNINFGLFPPLENPPRDKKLKKAQQLERAQSSIQGWLGTDSSIRQSTTESAPPL